MKWEHRTIIRANTQEEVLKLRAKTYIDNLEPEPEREYEVIVRVYKNKRSLEQNAYFHGVICDYMARELGYSLEEAKTILKAQLLPIVPVELPDGRIMKTLTETSKLKTKEMSKFIDDCLMLLASYDIAVPPPTYKGVVE